MPRGEADSNTAALSDAGRRPQPLPSNPREHSPSIVLEESTRRLSPRPLGSRDILRQEVGRRHSAPESAIPQFRKQAHAWRESAARDEGGRWQSPHDTSHRSAGAGALELSGQPQLLGERRRRLASFPGIIMVMLETRQVGIAADHFACEADGQDRVRRWNRHAAHSSLRGMSEVPHSLPHPLHSVSQRILSRAHRCGFIGGICPVLLLQRR
jgi:hypothetical protein